MKDGLGQRLLLACRFLNVVFTKEQLAGGQGLCNGGDGVTLGNGHQADGGRVAAATKGGLPDPGSDPGEFFGNGHGEGSESR